MILKELSLMLNLPPKELIDGALCTEVDMDMFFPDEGQSVRPALRVCAMCPVSDLCLEYALSNHERHGVWGGVVERDRRRMVNERKGEGLEIAA